MPVPFISFHVITWSCSVLSEILLLCLDGGLFLCSRLSLAQPHLNVSRFLVLLGLFTGLGFADRFAIFG